MGLLNRIADNFRRAADRLERLGLVAPPKPLEKEPGKGSTPWSDKRYRQVSHPEHGLTPRRIVDVYRRAECGFLGAQCDLFTGMIERDGHTRAQYEQRIESVAGKDWIVQAGDDRPKSIDNAKMLEERIRQSANFREYLQHQLTASAYGFGPSAPIWNVVDGMLAPQWFCNLEHNRFRADDHDNLYLLTDKEPFKGEALEPGHWSIHRHGIGRLARSGYMRTAVPLNYFKSQALAGWIIWLDRFGQPVVYGQYGEMAGPEERAALTEQVEKLGKDGASIFSEASKIVIDQAKGGGSDGVHPSIIAFVNDEVSKLITGSILLADGADGGSYAQANVQKNRSFDIVQAEATGVALTFTRSIGLPFVLWNGLDGAAPTLKLFVQPESDPTARAALYKTGGEIGVEMSKQQFRQEFQMKTPTGPDDIMKPPAPAPAPGGSPPPDK
jgi:phage gp29-like protein